jgi:hypothetical protein
LFGESGVNEVGSLFDDPATQVNISALSIPEVYARLRAIGREDKWPDVWGTYSELFSSVIAADEAVAHKAVQLREDASKRLPTIDGLIAASDRSKSDAGSSHPHLTAFSSRASADRLPGK